MYYLKHFNPNHDKLGRFAKGINSGQPDIKLKRGTKLNRISKTKNSKEWKKKKGRTYVFVSDTDKHIYTAASNAMDADTMLNLKTKKDAMIAGRKAQVEAFVETLKEIKINDLIDHTSYLDLSVNPDFFKRAKGNTVQEQLKSLYEGVDKNQKGFNTAYDAFITNIQGNDKATKIFYDKLKEKGYDGIIDDYDSRDRSKIGLVDHFQSKKSDIPSATEIYSESAMVFFDRHKSTKLEHIDDISYDDIQASKKWLEENGYYKKKFNDRFVFV